MNIRKPKKQVFAAVICVMLLAVLLLSAIFIIKEANHDCTGENCPICACMNAAERTLKQLGTGVIYAAVMIFPALIMPSVWKRTALILPCSTPVSRKTRMNN